MIRRGWLLWTEQGRASADSRRGRRMVEEYIQRRNANSPQSAETVDAGPIALGANLKAPAHFAEYLRNRR
jgi:hypothetical protein